MAPPANGTDGGSDTRADADADADTADADVDADADADADAGADNDSASDDGPSTTVHIVWLSPGGKVVLALLVLLGLAAIGAAVYLTLQQQQTTQQLNTSTSNVAAVMQTIHNMPKLTTTVTSAQAAVTQTEQAIHAAQAQAGPLQLGGGARIESDGAGTVRLMRTDGESELRLTTTTAAVTGYEDLGVLNATGLVVGNTQSATPTPTLITLEHDSGIPPTVVGIANHAISVTS